MNKHGIEFVMPDIMFEQAVQKKRETNQERVKHIINNEYSEWLYIRQYVRENMWKLKGQYIPIEISSLTDIEHPYNCVFLNDMEIRPYLSIYDEIKLFEAKEEQAKKNRDIEAMICPKCESPLEIKQGVFNWGGTSFSGHVCLECKSNWDYDDEFLKYTQAYAKLQKKGRVSGTT